MTGITLRDSIWQGYWTMQEESDGLSLGGNVPYFINIEILQLTWQNQKDLPLRIGSEITARNSLQFNLCLFSSVGG